MISTQDEPLESSLPAVKTQTGRYWDVLKFASIPVTLALLPAYPVTTTVVVGVVGIGYGLYSAGKKLSDPGFREWVTETAKSAVKPEGLGKIARGFGRAAFEVLPSAGAAKLVYDATVHQPMFGRWVLGGIAALTVGTTLNRLNHFGVFRRPIEILSRPIQSLFRRNSSGPTPPK